MDPKTIPLAFFRKASASISGPFDDIVKPGHVEFLDYEVEIGLVIGQDIPVGTTISEANLSDYIAGLVVTNDVSARDIQLPQTQFYEAKSYPTFTPVGPALVLLDADEQITTPDWQTRSAGYEELTTSSRTFPPPDARRRLGPGRGMQNTGPRGKARCLPISLPVR